MFALASIGRAQPSIGTAPASTSVIYGQPANLAVSATGTGTLIYQWYQGNSGDSSTPLSGKTSATLSFASATTCEHYWVRVTDNNGSTNSAAALVLPWTVLTSPDGSQDLYSASYANGKYFITGAGYLASSADGTNWIPAESGSGNLGGSNVVFGNGTYVVGGGSTTQGIYTSPDAVTWSNQTINAETRNVVLRSFYTGSLFLATGAYIDSSPDGVTWTTQSDDDVEDFAAGGGKIVAVGMGGVTYSSSNGTTWSSSPQSTNLEFMSVSYGHGRFVALASLYQPGPVYTLTVWTSTNGSTWTQGQLPTHGDGTAIPVYPNTEVAYGAGIFVAQDGPDLLMSDDGLKWTLTEGFFPQPGSFPSGLTYGSGCFVSVGPQGTLLKSLSPPAAVYVTSLTPSSYLLSGQVTTLDVAASGTNLTYQWYQGTSGDTSHPIAGATHASYTIPPISQNVAYWVHVSDGPDDAESGTISLTLGVAPLITAQPQDTDLMTGSASFSASVTGIPTPTLQWFQGRRGDTSHPVSGGTGMTLTTPILAASTQYWVQATNFAGTANSEAAIATPWFTIPPPPAISNAYNFSGTFVAIGSTVQTSADGATWTTLPTNLTNALDDIAYGNGLYVAVGGSGYFTSPDLITWTLRHNPVPPNSYVYTSSVCWDGSKFVAVGHGFSSVSTDGITWTDTALPTNVILVSVIFDGHKFVAAGLSSDPYGSTGYIYYSSNGVAWFLAAEISDSTTLDTGFRRVSVVNGKYVAVGYHIATSPDGFNWTVQDADIRGTGGAMNAIGYINGVYVVSSSFNETYTSPDGASWTSHIESMDLQPRCLLNTGSLLEALGFTGFYFSTSDGLAWTATQGAPAANSLGNIAYGDGQFVMAGSNFNEFNSSDGLVWQRIIPEFGGQDSGQVAYGCGEFISPDTDHPGGIWTSPDGFTWTMLTVPGATHAYSGAMFAGGKLFAVNQYEVAVSSDGVHWTDTVEPYSIGSIAYGNGAFVGVGNSTAVSTDGITWNPSAPISGGYLYGVAFGNGTFVAVGGTFQISISTSPDGLTWTSQTVPFDVTNLNGIEFLGGRFMARTLTGMIISRDGIHWVTSLIGPAGDLAIDGKMLLGGGLRSAPLIWNPVQNDINGDGTPDVIWQNSATGERGAYIMNGTSATSWASLGTVSTDWTIAAVADFAGNGSNDILWQNTSTGECGFYLMNGTTVTGWKELGTAPAGWRIAGAGDFEGNGDNDILWQNMSTGECGFYLMNGTAITGWAELGTVPIGWRIAAVSDFNNDGQPDIVWQNSITGACGIYIMNGTSVAGWADLGTVPLQWRLAAVGDFSANGNSDILWENSSTGACGFYIMNGTLVSGWANLGVAPLQWHIAP
jgi:Ig-like domain-containing protein